MVDEDLFNSLRLKRKAAVSITIDEDLLMNLQNMKKEEKIKELSPMINNVLWKVYQDWKSKKEVKK